MRHPYGPPDRAVLHVDVDAFFCQVRPQEGTALGFLFCAASMLAYICRTQAVARHSVPTGPSAVTLADLLAAALLARPQALVQCGGGMYPVTGCHHLTLLLTPTAPSYIRVPCWLASLAG